MAVFACIVCCEKFDSVLCLETKKEAVPKYDFFS